MKDWLADFIDATFWCYQNKENPGKTGELTFNMLTHRSQQDFISRLVGMTKNHIRKCSDQQEKPQVEHPQPEQGTSNEVF